jgi:hypothetical protein
MNQLRGYRLEGTLLEGCSCGILCPCWVGEDPDLGACYAFNAYHIGAGYIGDVNCDGLNFVRIVDIPGNVLTPGSWKQVVFLDNSATEVQREALVCAFGGELGGPLADVAGLIGETLGVETADITHEVTGGKGSITITGVLDAEMEPFRGPDSTVTTLRDSLFSTVPGSPAWVGKTTRHQVTLPKYGMEWSYDGRNAIQSEWKIGHAG